MISKEKELNINFDDEIIKASCLSFDGKLVNAMFDKGE